MLSLKKLSFCGAVVSQLAYGFTLPSLSPSHANAIGQQIWANEANRRIDQLTFWSSLEPFPSLGIGHCLWFPKGYNGPYTQTFPDLIAYLAHHNVMLPTWLHEACLKGQGCPWSTREQFYSKEAAKHLAELRSLLSSTIALQISFMIERLGNVSDDLLKNSESHGKSTLESLLQGLASSPQGLYVLLDYLNFKGSGTDPKERYHGTGWGLLQVLERMANTGASPTAENFAKAADSILKERVKNAPHESPDSKRLAGWLNRIRTYVHPIALP